MRASFHSAVVILAFSQSYAASADAVSLIERGHYLATAGNCASCHTVQGRPPFSGGVPFKTSFGSVYSTNITPHRGAGIGGWSKTDFERAMRKGIRVDGAHLYPVFPFPSFTKVADEDIDAIWAYLETIPPSDAKPPANELYFPFNQRWLMGLWKWMFFEEQRYKADPAKSADWNRGAYLVQGLAHCGACHTPRNTLGAEKEDEFLSGGSYVDHVPSGELRSWSAVNLTSSPNGLKAWSANDIALYLKTGHNPRAAAFGPMTEVIANSTRHLTDTDIRSIATYLNGLAPQGRSVDKPTVEQVAAGENVYTVHCGTCHLPTGLGDADTGPPLVGSAVVLSDNPASLINIILYGTRQSPLQRTWKRMEAIGHLSSDEEIADLGNFLRGSWGNAAPSITSSEVAKQR